MKYIVQVEKFLTGEKATLYTIRFIDSNGIADNLNETQKFFGKLKNTHPEEYQIYKALIKNILTKSGLKEKFFRDERNSDCEYLRALIKYDDRGEKYKGNLRLFCLYYPGNGLILGNGDFKKTRTFNEDVKLNKIARVLQKLDKVLYEKEKEDEVFWKDGEIKSGNKLIFEIDL